MTRVLLVEMLAYVVSLSVLGAGTYTFLFGVRRLVWRLWP